MLNDEATLTTGSEHALDSLRLVTGNIGQGEGHMTDSDETLPESSDSDAFDPLSAPSWMFENDDDILLAPPPEKFFSDFGNPVSSTPVAPPPNVDQIISGEYTGWVPIIKAGESLAQAQARADEVRQDVLELEVELNSAQVDVQESPETTQQVYFVADPDEVVSPAQALAQARERIAAMRASLQVNLNKVASSFEHPIFTDPEPTQQSEPQTTTTEAPAEATQQPPQVTHIYVQSETQDPPVVEQQVASPEHSLELMIMRDEIKDLRDRLDASQKLIEDLMHRLANLAELALKRQN